MGADRDLAPRALPEPRATSPRTSTRSSCCCGASRRRRAELDRRIRSTRRTRSSSGDRPASSSIRGRGSRACATVDFSFGTRIHGNIAALLAGRPRSCSPTIRGRWSWPATSRSRIGSWPRSRPDTDAAELYAEADYGALVRGHAARFATFTAYLARHGLGHVFQPGEDPAAFDRRMASNASRRRSTALAPARAVAAAPSDRGGRADPDRRRARAGGRSGLTRRPERLPGPGEPWARRAASRRRPDDAPRGVDPGPAGPPRRPRPRRPGVARGSSQGGCAMRKPLLSLAAVALVVGACGGSAHRRAAPAASRPTPDITSRPPPPRRPAASALRRGHLRGSRDQPLVDTDEDRVSTFALDVDTASYTIAQRYVADGNTPDPASVRVEEWVNAFDQGYPAPRRRHLRDPRRRRPDSVHRPATRSCSGSGSRPASRPSGPAPDGRADVRHRHLRIDGARGPARAGQGRAAQARRGLGRGDSVAVVTFGDEARVVLPPTRATDDDDPVAAIDELQPGGSTNLEAGLRLGYQLARETLLGDGIDRVILASDGVANVGLTDADGILRQIRDDAAAGIELVSVGCRDGQLQRCPARAAGRPGRRLLRLRQRPGRGATACSSRT